jgi:hypothetical protein
MVRPTKATKSKSKRAAKNSAPAKKPAPPPTTAEAKPSKKGKQLKLPAEGMARKSDPEVDAAAERFRSARDTRMEHTKLEKAAKANLLEVAKAKGIKVYVYESEDGEEFSVEYTEKQDEDVKVKKVKPDEDE